VLLFHWKVGENHHADDDVVIESPKDVPLLSPQARAFYKCLLLVSAASRFALLAASRKCFVLSSSSIYWHSNLVASADWLRMLAHVHILSCCFSLRLARLQEAALKKHKDQST
jgi:hypothetical protein